MWKLDVLVKLDHEAHAKLEEKKGRKMAFHKNREITVEAAREYKRVINSGNFAMLIEYCGERTLEGGFFCDLGAFLESSIGSKISFFIYRCMFILSPYILLYTGDFWKLCCLLKNHFAF